MRSIIFSFLLLLAACQKPGYEVKVLPQEGGGYGFQVFQGEKLLIDQPHIPGVTGKNPFPTQEAAEQVAGFMVLKMEKGIFPPSLTASEVDSLLIISE